MPSQETAVPGRALGNQLREAPGLDPKRVREITITCAPDGALFQMYPDEGEAEGALARYRLEPIEEAVNG